MPFEPFDKKRYYRSHSKGKIVSISKYCGKIIFSIDFMEKEFKDRPGFNIFYDRSTKIIGIRPVDSLKDESFEIKKTIKEGKRQQQYSYHSCILAFLNHFGITHSETKRYIPTWNETEQFFEIDLTSPIGPSKRKKSMMKNKPP
jgi:hypothetical protein